MSIEAELKAEALAAGFAEARITTAAGDPRLAERLATFLADGHHGDMDWLAATAGRRSSPLALWPEARSVVMLAMPYGDGTSDLDGLQLGTRGLIARYARGRDYHDHVKARLKRVARWLASASGAEVKVFVDTAPVLEKPLAARAGLGWQGKHTNLVSPRLGSWLLLGAIFTTAGLVPDAEETDHCGSCRRCLAVCPTDAFPEPYRLDARRCISYLTIEHKGHIERSLRPAIGNRIFGCDDCLAVCPWNKFARAASDMPHDLARDGGTQPLKELLGLGEAAFRDRFRGTPIRRTGRDRFLRNVLIAAGNSGEEGLLPAVVTLLGDVSGLVRAMAVWAFGRLATAEQFAIARDAQAGRESDPAVAGEWRQGAAP